MVAGARPTWKEFNADFIETLRIIHESGSNEIHQCEGWRTLETVGIAHQASLKPSSKCINEMAFVSHNSSRCHYCFVTRVRNAALHHVTQTASLPVLGLCLTSLQD